MTDQTSRAPRTDAAEFKATRIGSNLPEYVVCSDEARTIELEAADLRERLAKAREEAIEECARVCNEHAAMVANQAKGASSKSIVMLTGERNGAIRCRDKIRALSRKGESNG